MCIFCKIAEGEIPSYKIYEDDVCIAFLDLSQANVGHTLVVPKKHFDNILTLDDETASHLFVVTKKLTKAISKTFNVTDFNILNNCGEVAGQSVHHFHIHIIPRYKDDGIKMKFTSHELTTEEFNKVKNDIISNIK